MITLTWLAILLLQAPADDQPVALAAKYLARCQEAKTAQIQQAESDVKQLKHGGAPADKLAEAVTRLQRLQTEPASPVALAMPPVKGDVGVLQLLPPRAEGNSQSIEVLEVIDGQQAIVRLWYPPGPDDAPSDRTFVDVWVAGVEAREWEAGKLATLGQVFHCVGSQNFSTTCGGRSVPRLDVLDVERFRAK